MKHSERFPGRRAASLWVAVLFLFQIVLGSFALDYSRQPPADLVAMGAICGEVEDHGHHGLLPDCCLAGCALALVAARVEHLALAPILPASTRAVPVVDRQDATGPRPAMQSPGTPRAPPAGTLV